jgi:hypothetical protein
MRKMASAEIKDELKLDERFRLSSKFEVNLRVTSSQLDKAQSRQSNRRGSQTETLSPVIHGPVEAEMVPDKREDEDEPALWHECREERVHAPDIVDSGTVTKIIEWGHRKPRHEDVQALGRAATEIDARDKIKGLVGENYSDEELSRNFSGLWKAIASDKPLDSSARLAALLVLWGSVRSSASSDMAATLEGPSASTSTPSPSTFASAAPTSSGRRLAKRKKSKRKPKKKEGR